MAVPLLPVPPRGLVEAARQGRLVPFVGAGASKLAGCPGWAEFADAALAFYARCGAINFSSLAQLASLAPRVKLSLAHLFERRSGHKLPVRELIHQKERSTQQMGRRLYAAIARLGNTPVTTNYDEWLDDDLTPEPPASLAEGGALPEVHLRSTRAVYFRRAEMTLANLNQANAVLHLHGSVREPDTMVVTTRDYLAHYANDRFGRQGRSENPILSFLEDLFKNKVVLFIGYGLEELEILEYVLLKAAGSIERGTIPPLVTDPQHFILQGFYTHEQQRMLAMESYFKTFGVQLIPFNKDEKGYGQLVDVVEHLAQELEVGPLTLLQELTEMERLLDD